MAANGGGHRDSAGGVRRQEPGERSLFFERQQKLSEGTRAGVCGWQNSRSRQRGECARLRLEGVSADESVAAGQGNRRMRAELAGRGECQRRIAGGVRGNYRSEPMEFACGRVVTRLVIWTPDLALRAT